MFNTPPEIIELRETEENSNCGRWSSSTVEKRTIQFHVCTYVLERKLTNTCSTVIDYECSRTTKAILAISVLMFSEL